MNVKNGLSILLGTFLLIASGVLFAFHSGEGDSPEKTKKVKITIVKDNNGSLEKTEEIIEVKSREDVKAYLKSQNVEMSELNFYGKRGGGHGHPRHAKMWVYNASGKPMEDGHRVMVIKDDVNVSEKSDGDKTEKVIVKTIVVDDSESNESQEIKIKKEIDENGNIVVHKWVNGDEVDPDAKLERQYFKMNDENGEMTIEIKGENGQGDKIVKIKKEVDKDGNVTMMKSVNGGEFKKVEGKHCKKECEKEGANGGHSCSKGVGSGKGRGHHHKGGNAGHGARGFAARSSDGSVMVFGVPVDEEGNELSKKSVQEKNDDLVIENVTFYPNPTESKFSITFNTPEKGKIQIQVKDLQGKEVLNEEFDHDGGDFKQQLELKDAEAGMYIFTVTQNSKVYSHKLMVH